MLVTELENNIGNLADQLMTLIDEFGHESRSYQRWQHIRQNRPLITDLPLPVLRKVTRLWSGQHMPLETIDQCWTALRSFGSMPGHRLIRYVMGHADLLYFLGSQPLYKTTLGMSIQSGLYRLQIWRDDLWRLKKEVKLREDKFCHEFYRLHLGQDWKYDAYQIIESILRKTITLKGYQHALKRLQSEISSEDQVKMSALRYLESYPF